MYENTSKTISADSRLKAAYMARLKGVIPAMPFSSLGAGNAPPGMVEPAIDGEDDPELMEFLGYGSGVSGSEGPEQEDAGDS